MPFRLKPTPKQLIIIAITVTIAACGVGGGGGGGGGSGDESDNYPGYTDFQVENDSLDSGDLTNVTLTVHDVNKDGVILKFHYPKSLKYQSHSAQMYSGDDETWGQTTPYTEASTDSGRYLVFFLSRPPKDETNRVAVTFNVRALSTDSQAYIEVDLDNDDPTIPDSKEFSASDPKFSNDDRWNISIDGDPIATPTPSATGTPSEG